MGDEQIVDPHLSHLYHINHDSRDPQGITLGPNTLSRSSEASESQDTLVLRQLLLLTSLVNSAKSLNSDQRQIIEDMQMTKMI